MYKMKVEEYIVFDSIDRKIYIYSEVEVFENIHDFYGLRIQDNSIMYIGYNYIPTINEFNDWSVTEYFVFSKKLKNKFNWNSVDVYTIVGKFIEKKKKYFLIVNKQGRRSQILESDILYLNHKGFVTNSLLNISYIKLRKGSIPMFTHLRGRNKKTENLNTIKKVKDIRELKNIMTTTGVGKKFLARRIRDGKVGMAKVSVTSQGYDNINEVVCYELGKLFGVRACEASFETYNDDDYVISIYAYNYEKENIHTCLSVFGTDNFHKRFNMRNLEKMYGREVVDDFNRMVIFDLLVRQTDRHIGNFAFYKDRLYPLYDNGRCLFWDKKNLKTIDDLVTTFHMNQHGYGWAYVDGVLGPYECKRLINPNVKYLEIENILKKYYEISRAKILSSYIYRVYNLILGGYFNA